MIKIRPYLFPVLLIAGALLFRNWYTTPDVDTGDVAFSFTATTLDGSDFNLDDLRGNYVLLHFWGSWCGPCRRQHPRLVTTVKSLEDGLIPVSIAIEKDRSRWLAAIERDGLYWPHHIMDQTTNYKFLNGPISDLYGVNQVPTEFLLDRAGRLIAVNPPFSEIAKLIEDAR